MTISDETVKQWAEYGVENEQTLTPEEVLEAHDAVIRLPTGVGVAADRYGTDDDTYAKCHLVSGNELTDTYRFTEARDSGVLIRRNYEDAYWCLSLHQVVDVVEKLAEYSDCVIQGINVPEDNE